MNDSPPDPVAPLPLDAEDDLVEDGVTTPRRTNLVTLLLLGALLLGAGFVGGVAVQKDVGTAADAPVLTGVVQAVDGNVVRVADNAGALTTVTVPDTAAVTLHGIGATLTPGTAVTVRGTTWSDGSVRATAVVAQAPGG